MKEFNFLVAKRDCELCEGRGSRTLTVPGASSNPDQVNKPDQFVRTLCTCVTAHSLDRLKYGVD